jgi:hypothetical protein
MVESSEKPQVCSSLPSRWALGHGFRLQEKGRSATEAIRLLWQKAPEGVKDKRLGAREFRNNYVCPSSLLTLHPLSLAIFSLSGIGLAEDHLQ